MLRFAITPGALHDVDAPEAVDLVNRCAGLASRGVEYLLLREKKLDPSQRIILARTVAAACGGMRIIVPEIPAGEGFARHQRLRDLPAEGWASVSCHTVDEVRVAAGHGASAILFAPVFGKTVDGVEVVPGSGLDTLRKASVAAGQVPVFALGGVTEANAAACVEAGAAGVAGIRMFFE